MQTWALSTTLLTHELLGTYSGSGVPLTKVDEICPIDAIQVHENCHKDLTHGTSLGQYMGALSYASAHSEISKIRTAAGAMLGALVDDCWHVHEGYATMIQLLYLSNHSQASVAANLFSALPPSYRRALGYFRTNDAAIYELVYHRLTAAFPKPNLITRILKRVRKSAHEELKIDEGLVTGIALSHMNLAAQILAYASMSVPLSAALNSQPHLPSHSVRVLVRRDSPDNRLKLLAPKITPEFLADLGASHALAQRAAEELQQWTPIDEVFFAAGEYLCGLVGLKYERPDATALEDVYRKLGCHHITIADGRLLSPREKMVHHLEGTVVGNDRLGSANVLPFELVEQFFTGASHSHPEGWHVVCEVGGLNAAEALVVVHLYYGKAEMLRMLERMREGTAIDAPMRDRIDVDAIQVRATKDSAAFKLIAMPIAVAGEDVYTLPKLISGKSWRWIVGDLLSAFDLDRLKESGDVTKVLMDFRRSRVMECTAIHRLPNVPQTVQVEQLPWGVFGAGVPSGLCIQTFRDDEGEYVALRTLGELLMEIVDAQDATFYHCCLGDALLNGVYSELLKSLAGRL